MVHKLPLNLSNPRYSLPSPGVLIVANIQEGDHDTPFECVATNIHGMVYSRSTRLMHECMYIYFFSNKLVRLNSILNNDFWITSPMRRNRAVFKWLSKVITWLRLLRLVIGLKESRQFFNQWEAKPKPIAPCTRDFPALQSSYRWLLGIVIGSSRYSFLSWLVGVIAFVLVFRQSFENRSNKTFDRTIAQNPCATCARFFCLLNVARAEHAEWLSRRLYIKSKSNLGLWREEKPEVAPEKPLGAEQRNSKFSPQVALSPHSNPRYIFGRRMHTPLCQHIAFVIFIIITISYFFVCYFCSFSQQYLTCTIKVSYGAALVG